MKANFRDLGEIFGEPIAVYTRAQAIADGLLVDVSNVLTPCPFKYPVAMTRAAWAACIEAGGTWTPCGNAETLDLPGGQDVKGRTHDVFQMLLFAMRHVSGAISQIRFTVSVDERGNGHRHPVKLYSVCGPGDNAEPVITIMLQGED